MKLIRDLFSYKTAKFGERRPIIYSFMDAFCRLYHTRETANFQALMPLIWNIALFYLKSQNDLKFLCFSEFKYTLFSVYISDICRTIPISDSSRPLRTGFLNTFVTTKLSPMSYTKISRYRQLNAWRMEITTCTGNFFLQNNIFSNGSQRQKIARIRKQTE